MISDGGRGVVHGGGLAPDIIVIDLNMPGMGGVEATRRIAEIAPLTAS